jgi:hypothetical protein
LAARLLANVYAIVGEIDEDFTAYKVLNAICADV